MSFSDRRRATRTSRARKGKTAMAVTDQPNSKSGVAETEAVGPGNIDQIREIIFGPQMQDYERRFGRLEQRVEKEVTALRDDTAKRLDALERNVKREIEALLGRLKAETDERSDAVKEQARELGESAKQLGQLSERTTAAQRELHTEILEQSKSLRDDLHRAEETISAELSGVAEELRRDKAGRDELAGLFVAFARHLGGDKGECLKKEGSGPANAWR
jgi:vacuolar-type H+-ATPase subunit I/STV1